MSIKSILEDQKKRLTNVKDVLVAAVTGKGVHSNTGAPVVDKVLSAAASNPFLTALPVGVAKAGGIAASAALAQATPKVATATIIGTPILTSAVVSNPGGAVKTAKKAAGVTQDLSNFGGNLASIDSFEDVVTTAKENPVLSAGVIAATGLVVKGGVNAVTTVLNTQAVKENTETAKKSAESVLKTDAEIPNSLSLPSTKEVIPSNVPLTPATQVLGKEVAARTSNKTSRTRTSTKAAPQSQSLRITINNQGRTINTKYLNARHS